MTLCECNTEYQDSFVQLSLEFGKCVTWFSCYLRFQPFRYHSSPTKYYAKKERNYHFHLPVLKIPTRGVNTNYKYHVQLLKNWIVKLESEITEFRVARSRSSDFRCEHSTVGHKHNCPVWLKTWRVRSACTVTQQVQQEQLICNDHGKRRD
jgi:hypothetical protein